MNISQVGINLIKSFEGCRLSAYKPVPTETYWTIGYGHYGPDVKQHQTITQQQAEDLLRSDLVRYENGVLNGVKVKLNQYQFDALVSLCYNIGISAFQKSDLCAYLNKGDFNSALKEFDKWVHGGGKVLPGLVTRRNAEQALFVKQVEVKTPPKKEEDDMLEKAIVINSVEDFVMADRIAEKFGYPMFKKSSIQGKKVAKELIVVGYDGKGLVADKLTVLAGTDRYGTAAVVKKYLG